MENVIVYIVVFFVGLFLFLFVAKWVFKIDTIVMELKALRKLISMIAENSGIEKSEITRVNDVANRG